MPHSGAGQGAQGSSCSGCSLGVLGRHNVCFLWQVTFTATAAARSAAAAPPWSTVVTWGWGSPLLGMWAHRQLPQLQSHVLGLVTR